MIGAIILPKSSPNFTQTKFNGLSNLELSKPKTKNIIDIGIGQILNDPSCIIGQIAIIAKTIQKSIPKLLLELMFFISPLIYYCLKIFKSI